MYIYIGWDKERRRDRDLVEILKIQIYSDFT